MRVRHLGAGREAIEIERAYPGGEARGEPGEVRLAQPPLAGRPLRPFVAHVGGDEAEEIPLDSCGEFEQRVVALNDLVQRGNCLIRQRAE